MTASLRASATFALVAPLRLGVLQRLPGQVVEEQRGELIRTLSQARNLVIEVQCSPAVLVRVRDGQRLLVGNPRREPPGRPHVRITGQPAVDALLRA